MSNDSVHCSREELLLMNRLHLQSEVIMTKVACEAKGGHFFFYLPFATTSKTNGFLKACFSGPLFEADFLEQTIWWGF